MVIIYGRRAYGRVDAHGGEHAQTTFAHVYYMPLFPIQSFWITQDGEDARGFEIPMHGKSVLAAYLRMWGPLVAIACFVAGGVGATLAGALFGALGVAAWLARGAGAHTIRRSDFNVIAYGTRCEPARMPSEMRDRMKHALAAQWEQIGGGRPPEDVAQYGARTMQEAATAYGLLRLAGVDRRDPGAHAAADRIVAGTYDAAPAGDGPYREDAGQGPLPSEVISGAALAAASAAHAAQIAAAAAAATGRVVAPPVPWWALTRGKGFLVSILAAVGLAGIAAESPALRGARTVDASDIAVARGNHNAFVQVRCDAVELLGTFSDDDGGYGCTLGNQTLLVVADAHRADNRTIVGTLFAVDSLNADEEWPYDLRIAPNTLRLYLTEKSIRTPQVAAVLCMFGELLLAGIVVFWIVQRRRARRAPDVV